MTSNRPRADRATSHGSVAGSIAHEIRQPATMIGPNGGAVVRWLKLHESDVDDARVAVSQIVWDAEGAEAVSRGSGRRHRAPGRSCRRSTAGRLSGRC
jgi:hypothetical protein